MSFRTILAFVDASPESDSRLGIAVGLASRFEASLSGISAGFPRPPLYYTGIGPAPDLIAVEREQIESDLKSAGERFAKLTAGSGLKTRWQAVFEIPSLAVAGAAAAADLVVIAGPGADNPIDEYRMPAAGDLLMRLGRPLVIVPPNAREAACRRVAIAWKNTREARRAIADSLPFLKRADVVTLFHIREPNENDAATADAASFLAGHGIDAAVEVADFKGPTAVDQIIRFAERAQIDLIVAGGYGHSRLREWIFGGVTRGLLAGCPIVCLISH